MIIWGKIGMMEKKMETTIVIWDKIGRREGKRKLL